MNKILFFAIYPAPYRVNLLDYFVRDFDIDFFCETSSGDNRNSDWFQKGNYYTLDTEEGQKRFASLDMNSYDLVAIYDFTTPHAMKLIRKCKSKKIPYIINCDGVMLTNHGNPLKDMLKKYLLKGAAAYLASGENAKRYFIKYGAPENKIFLHTFSTLDSGDVLEKPLSDVEKTELREKLGLPTGKKIAIAVGRFIPLKRYQELICEWKSMADDFLLLIIGGGEEEENYKKAIKDLSLTNVMIDGFHAKDELMDYYKASDVFVHPTSYDVWGLVVNEAMACGLPVVVSDHCVAGLELIKNGENGYQIPMGDDALMCAKTAEIALSGQRYNIMAQNSLDTIRPYTFENMALKHCDVFKTVLEK
ncbi:MAG: glycosyltransferase family 4 protein [Clostridia bacterium]|nr:glycosyltransferase family 4 protein [Clostridia bacterium]